MTTLEERACPVGFEPIARVLQFLALYLVALEALCGTKWELLAIEHHSRQPAWSFPRHQNLRKALQFEAANMSEGADEIDRRTM